MGISKASASLLALCLCGVIVLTLAKHGQMPDAWAIVTVRPQAVFVGSGINIACVVAAHADNRWVTIGLANTRMSGSQITEQSLRTHTLQVMNVPCDGHTAMCVVERTGQRSRTASVPVTVLGCDE